MIGYLRIARVRCTIPFLAVASAVLMLAACGGSGGGGGGGGGPPPPGIVANADVYVINPGATLTVNTPGVLTNDSNTAGGTLTVTLVSNVRHGTLTLNPNGAFNYQHDGSGANDSFVYRASNGTMNSNDASVSLNLNQAPTAINACLSTAVNTTATGTLSASDPDGQSLTYQVVTQPTKGSLSADAAGNFSYIPHNNVRGLDKFTFRARDANGTESNIGTVSLLVDGKVRIMPLGDSITEGVVHGLNDQPPLGQRVGYRRKLYGDLSTLSPRFGVDFVGGLSDGASANPPIGDPNHEGHGGATDGQVAANIISWLNANPADIILLHVGTNDFTTSAADVETLLNNINAWENANYPVWVFIARIIKTASGNLDVTTFNNNVAAMVAARASNRLFMVDQENGAGINYNTEMGDNLHPTQPAYDKMAQKWKTDILSAAVLPSCP